MFLRILNDLHLTCSPQDDYWYLPSGARFVIRIAGSFLYQLLPQFVPLLALGLLGNSVCLFIFDLDRDVRVTLEVVEPGWIPVLTRVRCGDHVTVVKLDISQRCGAPLAALAPGRGEQEDVKA
jgi:hypothetical protein